MAAQKQKQVNLLPQEEFASSTLGRILGWLLGSFRVIVIVTELVVMGAFLSRFWLDASVSDLNDEITQKQAVITAYGDFEKNFRATQSKVDIFSKLSKGALTANLLGEVTASLPSNAYLTAFSATDEGVALKGIAANEQGVAQLMANLEGNASFDEISLNQVTSLDEFSSLLVFSVSMVKKGG